MQAHRPGDILVVDGSPEFLTLASTNLGRRGHAVRVCAYVREAREHLERHHFDALLCALNLPDGSGAELCAWVKNHDYLNTLPVAMLVDEHSLAPVGDPLSEIMRGGSSDGQPLSGAMAPDEWIIRPLRSEELLVRVSGLLKMRRYREEIGQTLGTLIMVAQGIEEQDKRAQGHCQRLATLAVLMGAAAGCEEYELLMLERAGYLHDIGKVQIPGGILEKVEALTPREREIVREHPVLGEKLCRGVGALGGVLPIIRHHHERCDGTGYPDRLREKQIPPLAALFSIVDVFDSLLTWRPYRPAMATWQALEVLRSEVECGFWSREFFNLFEQKVLPVAADHLRAAGLEWPGA